MYKEDFKITLYRIISMLLNFRCYQITELILASDKLYTG